MALEGRAAIGQVGEQVDDDKEQEQNGPAVEAVLSFDTVVPLSGSRDVVVDPGDVGVWESSKG